MKSFVKILGVFAAGALIVSSCGKDYLDTTRLIPSAPIWQSLTSAMLTPP